MCFLRFFEKDKTDLRQNFFQDLGVTIVHYNQHWKAMHSAFKSIYYCFVLFHCK